MVFLTSRKDNIYNVLNVIFAKKFFGKKFDEKKIDYFQISRMYHLKFLFDFIKKLFLFKILSKEDIVHLSYQNANYGRYLLSVVYKDIRSYDSPTIFAYNFFKNLLIISKFYSTFENLVNTKEIGAVYLDHCVYLNGILFELFFNLNKTIYLNNYPKDLIEVKPSRNKTISVENCFRIHNKKYKITKKKNKKIKKIQNDIYHGKKIFYPWMIDTSYKQSNIEKIKKYDFIIYTHAFADAQLIWGYDGFINAYEWLTFTIDTLAKSKKYILVKAHPNFYLKQKKYKKYVTYEKYLFQKIISKYKVNKKIKFINSPVNNRYIMSQLKKDCIAITHHGSVGLELLLNNFKVISSVSNFYDKNFRLSNQWSNKLEYEKLLKSNWKDLKYHKKSDLLKICNELFLGETGYLSKNYHAKILKNFFVKKKLINKNASIQNITGKSIIQKNKKNIINELNFPINTIKFN